MEQKYKIANEYGSIMWDVEKILKDKDRFTIKEYDVKYLVTNNPFHGKAEYVMNTDITQPLIVVKLTENIDMLIDGNHRLQKAVKLGVDKILAYSLNLEEHRKYIVNYDEKIYCEVVKHWGN